MDRIAPGLHVGSLAIHESVDVREGFARVGATRDEADPHPALVGRAAAFVERHRRH